MLRPPKYARQMFNAEARGDRYLEFELKDHSPALRAEILGYVTGRGWQLVNSTTMPGPFRGIFRPRATISTYTFTR